MAGLYFLAAVFCVTLPASPPPASTEEDPHSGLGVGDAERAMGSTFGQLREGFSFIRANRTIAWSLIYLAIAASLVGVLGVLGPSFAKETLGSQGRGLRGRRPAARVRDRDRDPAAQLVRPLLPSSPRASRAGSSPSASSWRPCPRPGRSAASSRGPIAPGGLDLSGVTSLLAVVVVIAFFAGIAYGLVAIPSQTELQEDLPEDVRGRVFGVLGMLVSVASFLPIIIVGPIAENVGTTAVIFVMAIGVMVVGIVSVATRGRWRRDAHPAADPKAVDPIASALGADRPTWSASAAEPVLIGVEADVAEVGPGRLATVAAEPTGVVAGTDHAGPSDPTDRD